VAALFTRGTGEAFDPYLKSKLLLQRSAHGLARTGRCMLQSHSSLSRWSE
jgi:hypothetical protein